MSGIRAAVLANFVLLLCLVRSVRSDYADEQKNCTDSYRQLVDDLMDTADNEYLLSTTFFPPTCTQPFIVTVRYCFINATSVCKIWFWTTGKLYLILPPRILQYISLFFSDPAFKNRIKEVNLTLPGHCEHVQDGFMETLTQRLKFYAQYPKDRVVIPDKFVAAAYNITTINDNLYKDPYYGWNIIALIYSTHFLFPLSMIILFVLVACLYIKKKNKQDVGGSTRNAQEVPIACTTLLCSIFVTFVISVDGALLHYAYADYKNTGLHDLFFTSNQAIFAFPAVVAVTEIIAVLLTVLSISFGPFQSCIEKYNKAFMASVLCTFLCLSVHFPFIVSAWTTDEFHSFSILYWYIGIFSMDFIVCKYVFHLMLSCRSAGTESLPIKRTDYIVVIFSLFLATSAQVIMTVYYIMLPFNKAVEFVPQALNSIFQVIVAAASTLIAWKLLTLHPLWPYTQGPIPNTSNVP